MSRHPLYHSASGACTRAELPAAEAAGYVAEEKIDGEWACVTTDADGKIASVVGRYGAVKSGSEIAGLELVRANPNSIYIGELEASTEAATAIYRAIGYRRVWLHPVPGLGAAQAFWDATTRARLPLIRRWQSGLQAAYDAVISEGGEGLMLKHPDGAWMKCKHTVTTDLILCRETRTATGQRTARLGLWRDGKLCEVMACRVPDAVLDAAVMGQTVVEVQGFARHRSGAVRSARFVRVRTDKSANDCKEGTE